MSGFEQSYKEVTAIGSHTSEPSPEDVEQQRIDTVVNNFDLDRREALRILSGRVLAALHEVRLSRDETIPEAQKNKLTGTLAELVDAVEKLLSYERASSDDLEPTTEVAA